jgi:acyl transferase domain-containing protein
MDAGRCAVSKIPADRWTQSLHYHPRPKERGRSYTFAAGVLDDIWGFDPTVFRISPREAEQIDPQQRLQLELAFEACEDAGFAPSRLAGTGTGVYVGASALDYSTIGLHDPALAVPLPTPILRPATPCLSYRIASPIFSTCMGRA